MDVRTATSCLLLLLLGAAQAQPIVDGEEHPASVNETMDVGEAIIRMNAGSPDFLVEGDVMVPRLRSAMKCYNKPFNCLWPMSANGRVEIPFDVSEKYTSDEVEVILKALKDFQSKTCISFFPRETQRMYISFEPRYGCFSSLGRIGDRQVISLQRMGCVQHGIIQHEVMHALGFYHEHTRSDRDEHILIHRENIKDYYLSNFQKKDTNNLGLPYDYQSVMHYGRMAFSTGYGKYAMTPIPDASVPIGQREGLSDLDVLRLNKLYKCSRARYEPESRLDA